MVRRDPPAVREILSPAQIYDIEHRTSNGSYRVRCFFLCFILIRQLRGLLIQRIKSNRQYRKI